MKSLKTCGAALTGVMALTMAAPSWAQFWTERADVELTDALAPNAGGPPLEDVTFWTTNNGSVFTNTWQRVSGNDTPGLGDRVVSIYGATLSAVQNSEEFTPIVWTDDNDDEHQVALVGAIEGTIVEQDLEAGVFTLGITTGRQALVVADEFDRHNPSTWGFGTATDQGVFTAQQNVLAEWALKPPENVLPGFGTNITSPAAENNLSAINSRVTIANDGNMLMREDTGNGFKGTTYLSTDPAAEGDDTVKVQTNFADEERDLLDPTDFGDPSKFDDEGIFKTFQQQIELLDLTTAASTAEVGELGLTGTADGAGNETPSLWDDRNAQLSVMNEIAIWGGVTTGTSGAAGNTFGFATAFEQFTGFPTTVSAWSPGFDGVVDGDEGGNNLTGDFRALLTDQTDNYGGQGQPVPSPATIALVTLGLLLIGYSSRGGARTAG